MQGRRVGGGEGGDRRGGMGGSREEGVRGGEWRPRAPLSVARHLFP